MPTYKVVIKIIKTMLPSKLYNSYLRWRQNKVIKEFKRNPQSLAIKCYKKVFGEEPNLDNPKNLIEKIIWLQFNSDTTKWTLCADKYKVREYLQEKKLDNILCKLYGVWEKAEDIDFNLLPNKFVLKANHSCGQVLIVKDKAKLDINKTKVLLNSWLHKVYGYDNAQIHYTRINPCIIAEEYLEETEGESLVDYKIWCFNGEPECILVCTDRIAGKGIYSLAMFDKDWRNISSMALNQESIHYGGENMPKPENFDKMIEYARILSEGFQEVRVDLYNIGGRIIFGELTFTTGYGSYKKSFYDYLGGKVQLDR